MSIVKKLVMMLIEVLEELAAKTENKIDDAAVDLVKSLLENYLIKDYPITDMKVCTIKEIELTKEVQ